MVTLTDSNDYGCFMFTAMEDDIIEYTEEFNITLMRNGSGSAVEFVNESATIEIEDNDGKTCTDVKSLSYFVLFFYLPTTASSLLV